MLWDSLGVPGQAGASWQLGPLRFGKRNIP
jgi:hypothetical protein